MEISERYVYNEGGLRIVTNEDNHDIDFGCFYLGKSMLFNGN
jgi:hypothetical protein